MSFHRYSRFFFNFHDFLPIEISAKFFYMNVNCVHPNIHIVFVHFYTLVGPGTNWVCTITVIRNMGGGDRYILVGADRNSKENSIRIRITYYTLPQSLQTKIYIANAINTLILHLQSPFLTNTARPG